MTTPNTDPRDPTPISDPDAPKQRAQDDHKVAKNPPADERYRPDESDE